MSVHIRYLRLQFNLYIQKIIFYFGSSSTWLWVLLLWQDLTIAPWRDGFENRNKLYVVAYFHFETVLCMRHTLSPDRDGRLFCRYSSQRSAGRRQTHCRNVCRFAGFLVKGPNYTSSAAAGDDRFRLTSTKQDRTVQVLICLKMRASGFKIQELCKALL